LIAALRVHCLSWNFASSIQKIDAKFARGRNRVSKKHGRDKNQQNSAVVAKQCSSSIRY